MTDSKPDILLVEDVRIHARIVEHCLGDKYDLTVVTSAEEARTRLGFRVGISETNYDLLLVDWGLPEEDGLSFVKAVQNEYEFDVPIVMQTAKERAEHVQRALEAGIDDYVVKPVDCETLQRKVDKLLSDQKGEA